MTENEAIDLLAGELMNTNQNEPNKQEADQTNKQEVNQGENISQNEINSQIINSLEKISQKLDKNEPSEPNTQQNMPSEQEMALNELGLGSVAAQLAAQQKQLDEQQALIQAQQEQQRRQAVFDSNVEKLRKEFPTINPDDLGKWANENGLSDLVSENYNGWRVVAKAMINIARAANSPDLITSSNGSNATQSAFDRLQKGEAVDDLELGAEILKMSKG